MTSVELSDDVLAIAVQRAAAQGRSLRDWLTTAISQQAAAQQPVDEIPIDDGGFYSPFTVNAA